MATKKTTVCKRPYSLGMRLESSNRRRTAILSAVRAQLESNGFNNFSLDSLARESGVTRQTVHNLFGTKRQLLEALFDQLASRGGMTRMREVMQRSDPAIMLTEFVDVFCGFWSTDRLLIRRIHGIAAIDPEFGAVVEARNLRRKGAAERIVRVLARGKDEASGEDTVTHGAALYALTSFEFFDVLADARGSTDEAALLLHELVQKALMVRS
jgi:AcrR family transcriptional regulator